VDDSSIPGKEQRKGIKITRGNSGDIKERWMDDKSK
jgi:hypothetical protein